MTNLMASNFSPKCSSGDSKDPTSCFYFMLIKMNKNFALAGLLGFQFFQI
jgi:hypothetical protein